MASKRFARLSKILAGAVADAHEIFQLEGRLERFVHVWALVVRQYIHHRCFVRASALSYSTLLALIPLLAVTLNLTSIFAGPQYEEKVSRYVEKAISSIAGPAEVPTNSPSGFNPPASSIENTNPAERHGDTPENAETGTGASLTASNAPLNAVPGATVNAQTEIERRIHDVVQKTSNGALGIFGMIGLVFTSISLLRGIEDTFNDIWGITRGRSWGQQILLYSAVIFWGPLMISGALGLSGNAYMQHTRSYVESSYILAPVTEHLLPVAMFGLALGLLYKTIPNTKVELGAAMIGGLCAGTTWHIYNQLTFVFASRALGASKLYGYIFLFVLLMVGLYFLWVIVLFGAQVAYAYQNRTAYLQDRLAENVNQRGREFVALRIMTCLARRFLNGERPATVPEMSTELGVPSRLSQSILRTLATTRLVTEVSGEDAAFVPGRPPDAINAYDILLAMRTGTGQELPICDDPELTEIYGEFARIEKAERNAAAIVTLLALANRNTAAALPEPKHIEPQKPVVVSGAVVEMAAPEPVETPKPAPFPEKEEPPKPSPELPVADPSPRRETARPEDNTDFPL